MCMDRASQLRSLTPPFLSSLYTALAIYSYHPINQSMFVEIMGLQMNTERLNQKMDPSATANLVHFPNDIPPPPGGWPDWIPDVPALEDIPPEGRSLLLRPTAAAAPTRAPPVATATNETVTGAQGIATVQWYALERSAIEDALEQEERMRKDKSSSSSKRKSRPPPPPPPKKDKAVAAWRARVQSLVSQNHTEALQTFLHSTDAVGSWESLVPLVLPKNRTLPSAESRLILARHILQQHQQQPQCMFALQRADGRSVVHTACLYADVSLLEVILNHDTWSSSDDPLQSQLLVACQDSGWTPLHYAAVSGSIRTVETIFRCASNVGALCTALTNPSQTWKKGTNRGISPTVLAEGILSGKADKLMESHGSALVEITEHFLNSWYMLQTGFLYCRILAAETSGYVPLSEEEIQRTEEEFRKRLRESESAAASTSSEKTAGVQNNTKGVESEDDDDDDDSGEEQQQQSTKTKKKKKKKRKKKKAAAISDAPKTATPSAPTPTTSVPTTTTDTTSVLSPLSGEDPLMTALLGMGFEYDQVMDGIEGCGGRARATADDVVAWIFAQPQGKAATKKTTTSHTATSSSSSKQSKQQPDAAEKLAAKREEQRRRNREWNNRAQVRQAMEAQDKVAQVVARGAVAAPRPRTVTHGNMLTVGDVQIARKPRVQSTALPDTTTAGIDNIYSNEASTVASSLEHFEVEVGGNDDATVSTMGSFPAVPAPAPALPPGFGQGAATTTGTEPSVQQPPQWESQRPPLSGHMSAHIPALGSLTAPPGIPESGPLLDRPPVAPTGQRSQSFSIPPMANPKPPPQRSSFSSSLYPPEPSSLLSASHRPTDQLAGLGTSFLSDDFGASGGEGISMDHKATPAAFTGLGTTSGGVTPVVPGLLGFGADLAKNGDPQLDSAIIDSISTGNMGGSALWNDTPGPSSSLLGSLLANSSETVGSPFFTPSSSFNSNDNNANNNTNGGGSKNHTTTWQPTDVKLNPSGNGGGGSIW